MKWNGAASTDHAKIRASEQSTSDQTRQTPAKGQRPRESHRALKNRALCNQADSTSSESLPYHNIFHAPLLLLVAPAPTKVDTRTRILAMVQQQH
ncbi:hypothetical protein JX265_002340 [Neoarthrinium moseri]|uniref:Uncharacterized protein n=1 Tax=Neoarthrinium moseri TaxID=1658444 RepID=A0A9Q0AUP4_9PEZI|nr:uncharacterized protein JN550_000153 [Neoarthrinium moseri]KAI1854702.1 hypothetical protein JX266_000820 [Neoarthrinium moseri]KAI1877971.1 hypothetical protein JN550_000153 [Neoarthrinium moseri]KAI1879386.1 hypothetical protein JX265_002340 [Neoarthrinium moseri]